MSYDPKCYDLAWAFLDDEIEDAPLRVKIAHELAQGIQGYIEGWIEGFRDALIEARDRQ